MKKICPVCGKVFTTNNSRYKFCTRECAVIGYKAHKKRYYKDNPEKKPTREEAKASYRKRMQKGYQTNPKLCAKCGTPLPNRAQVYCLDCLLRDYKYNYTKRAAHRLSCRGHTAVDIWQLIESRGI